MHRFDAAGIAVYALSYDEPDALRDFRDAHGITYNLLSDPDSEVIGAFGILNTLIDPDDHPWFGIPYPGTYVVSSDGVITSKFFDNNLAVRVGPEQLLRAALGESVPTPVHDFHPYDDVELEVLLEGDTLTTTVQRDLVARFSVPQGSHVYADPPPDGSVGVGIVLDENEFLVERPIIRPASETHRFKMTGESFQVHHGIFEIRLPITVNGGGGKAESEIKVKGTVRWQACDDEVCGIPQAHRFELTVPVVASPDVALRGPGAELEPNAMSHFKRMTERRKK